jgi:hypothetical protein
LVPLQVRFQTKLRAIGGQNVAPGQLAVFSGGAKT